MRKKMEIINEEKRKQHCYVTYGRQFASYRWWKPLVAALVFLIIYFVLAIGLVIGASMVNANAGGSFADFAERFSGGYDTFSVSDVMGSVVNLGQIALAVPALFLTALIVRDRPFSSYSSARGGWNSKIFWRCFFISFFVMTVPCVIREYFFLGHKQIVNEFTWISLAVLLVLAPLQCIAEEYVFRGLFMQTLGSWFRIPVIAVALQAVIFAAAHPYNNIGKLTILISGIGLGLAAWIARGIEASSAIHVVNNLTAFILSGLGISQITSQVTREDLIFDAAVYSAYVVIVFIMSRSSNIFNRMRKDDLIIANEKYAAKMARKEAKKGGRSAAAQIASDPDVIVFGDAAETPVREPEVRTVQTGETEVRGRSGRTEGKHFKK